MRTRNSKNIPGRPDDRKSVNIDREIHWKAKQAAAEISRKMNEDCTIQDYVERAILNQLDADREIKDQLEGE